MDQNIHATVPLRNFRHHTGHRRIIHQIDAMILRRAAASAHRLDRGERCLRPFQRGDLLIHHYGSRAFSPQFQSLKDIPFQPFPVRIEPRDIRIVWIRLRSQIQQIEGASGCRGKIGRDGGDYAAGRARYHEDAILAERQPGIRFAGRDFFQSDRPALPILVADFHRAGIPQRFLKQQVGQCAGLAAGFKVHNLDGCVALLAFESFREARDGSAQRIRGAGGIIAVQAAEAGCGNQERSRFPDLIVERLHRSKQHFCTDPGCFTPLREAHAGNVGLYIQGRQPVNALDRAFGVPAFEILRQEFRIRRSVDNQRLNPEFLESANQSFPDSALIRHDKDPAPGLKGNAGWLALRQ